MCDSPSHTLLSRVGILQCLSQLLTQAYGSSASARIHTQYQTRIRLHTHHIPVRIVSPSQALNSCERFYGAVWQLYRLICIQLGMAYQQRRDNELSKSHVYSHTQSQSWNNHSRHTHNTPYIRGGDVLESLLESVFDRLHTHFMTVLSASDVYRTHLTENASSANTLSTLTRERENDCVVVLEKSVEVRSYVHVKIRPFKQLLDNSTVKPSLTLPDSFSVCFWIHPHQRSTGSYRAILSRWISPRIQTAHTHTQSKSHSLSYSHALTQSSNTNTRTNSDKHKGSYSHSITEEYVQILISLGKTSERIHVRWDMQTIISKTEIVPHQWTHIAITVSTTTRYVEHHSFTPFIHSPYLLTHHLRTHSFTHLLTYSLTHLLLTHLLTYSLTHLLTYSLTRVLTYSLTHILAYSRTHLLTYSLTHSTKANTNDCTMSISINGVVDMTKTLSLKRSESTSTQAFILNDEASYCWFVGQVRMYDMYVCMICMYVMDVYILIPQLR